MNITSSGIKWTIMNQMSTVSSQHISHSASAVDSTSLTSLTFGITGSGLGINDAY